MIGPDGGGVESADPDQDPNKIHGFWLGRDRRSVPPPRGGGKQNISEENKILARKTKYYPGKQNIHRGHANLAGKTKYWPSKQNIGQESKILAG